MTGGAGRRIGLAVFVVLVMGISAYLGTSRWKVPIDAPLLDGSTITVVPGVYLLGGLGPAAAYAVDDFVAHDGMQPGPKLLLGVPRMTLEMHSEQHVLHHILDIALRHAYPCASRAHHRPQARGQPLKQLAIRVGVAANGTHAIERAAVMARDLPKRM